MLPNMGSQNYYYQTPHPQTPHPWTPKICFHGSQAYANVRIATHTCIHTYIHTCIHTYIHTSILVSHLRGWPSRHTYMHNCIHSYIHTYIHTYIHSYRRMRTCGSRPAGGTSRSICLIHYNYIICDINSIYV